ncbi:TIR domain-containing protein [Patescibacteria group bacterium]|nr:TIR domain-containing protein [Patescibacteria group bacterium]
MTDYLSQLLSKYQPQGQKKRAFISFDFDNDEQLKNLLSGQAKNPDSPFYFEDWSVKEPFPQSTWKSDVRTKIKQCDFVIVLIGLNTHNCSGVLEEIRIANEENIPTFGIYEQGKNYYVPNGLGKRFIEWNWGYITNAINSLNSYLPQIYG